MKPMMQTIFGSEAGNCYSACIASILEIPVENVPNFCLKPTWLNDSCEWLEERGWTPIYIYVRDGHVTFNVPDDVYYIASGKSPRGDFNHSIVQKSGELAHDPHPSGAGIETYVDFVFLIKPKRRKMLTVNSETKK